MCSRIAAVEDPELRHLNSEPAFVQTKVEEETNMELPEEYRGFGGGGGDWQTEQAHPRLDTGLAMLQPEVIVRLQDAGPDPGVLRKIVVER